MSDRMPERMSEYMSDRIAGRMSEHMPDRMLDSMSEWMQHRISTQYVGVGINRIKLFFLSIHQLSLAGYLNIAMEANCPFSSMIYL